VLVLGRVARGSRVLAAFLGGRAHGVGSGRFFLTVLGGKVLLFSEGCVPQLPLPPLLKVGRAIGVDGLLREEVGSGASCRSGVSDDRTDAFGGRNWGMGRGL